LCIGDAQLIDSGLVDKNFALELNDFALELVDLGEHFLIVFAKFLVLDKFLVDFLS
jgi:hypothetical protein